MIAPLSELQEGIRLLQQRRDEALVNNLGSVIIPVRTADLITDLLLGHTQLMELEQETPWGKKTVTDRYLEIA